MWMLLSATALLLLIAVVNVTNLLLAHATARIREAAVRAALGASRADLVRERMAESIVFSTGGAALGWLVAWGMLRAFRTMDPGGIPRLAMVELDSRTLLFTIAVAASVALLTGLIPALRAPVVDVLSTLRYSRGTIGDRKNDRLRHVLVAAQVALSLVLLLGAGLLVRSLTQVLSAERGFQTEQRILATITIPGSYPPERRVDIAQTILTRVEALPQVASVASVSGRPLTGAGTGLGMAALDHPIPDSAVPWASWRLVTKGYFKTMGLPIIAGRDFTEHDIVEKPWRVIISRSLAERLWPGQSPIGRTAILWRGQIDRQGEVIGVVGDMRESGLESPPTLAAYFPVYGAQGATTLRLVMHTRVDPQAFTPVLRDVIRRIDSRLPISDVSTLDEIVTESVATRRFTMMLLVAFASFALVLSMAGVYGVLAYTLARRTAEFGVRLALGASPMQVLGRVFSRGMLPVAAGLVAGLTGAFWAARLMASLLFEIDSRDPVTFAAATAVILVTSALACYVPARQVLRVDPAVALRIE
jgi:putative ABC transport system permease protein